MVAVVPDVAGLTVELFADGADLPTMVKMAEDPLIKGFTTNPTLMRKAGISDYEAFARRVLAAIPDRPISLEVFADDLNGMVEQATKIAGWGPNVNVKVPVTTTSGEFCGPAISALSEAGVTLNVTALFTVEQVDAVLEALRSDVPAFISVFAGRIADTGRDPMPIMRESARRIHERKDTRLIWASPRELLNVFQADEVGCDIITATDGILGKLGSVGKDLDEFSLDTVRMFFDDASSAGYSI